MLNNTFHQKHYLFLAFLSIIIIPYPIYSQSCDKISLDSLNRLANSGKVEIIEKIDIWNQIANCYLDIDLDSTTHFAELALNKSKQNNYIKGQASSTLNLATAQNRKGNQDKSIELLDETIELYNNNVKDSDYLKAIILAGIIYEIRNDYDMALEYYFLGLKNAELLDYQLYIAFFYNNISIVYSYTGFEEKELEYIKKALKIFKELGEDYYYSYALVNIGSYYNNRNEFDSAYRYFLEAEPILIKDANYYGLTNLYNNLANMLMKIDKNEALSYFQKSLLNATLIDSLNNERKNRIGNANIDLGKYYIELQQYEVAKDYFKRAFVLGLKYKSILHIKECSHGLFNSFLYLNQIDSALYYLNLSQAYNDSLIAEIFNEKINNLKYDFQLEKERELMAKDKALLLGAKNRQELIYLIIVGILFTIAFVIFLVWYFQKTRLQKSELKRKNLRLEKENIQNILDKKNRELTTTVLNLIERNEFIAKLSERLQANEDVPGTDKPDSINNIIKTIDQDAANKLWKEFELRYMEVHKDFHYRLTTTYPTLTTNERKLCAFMVLNMSTKDISSITYQSEHSIKIARYRLRKKLGLSKNENLTSFLHNL